MKILNLDAFVISTQIRHATEIPVLDPNVNVRNIPFNGEKSGPIAVDVTYSLYLETVLDALELDDDEDLFAFQFKGGCFIRVFQRAAYKCSHHPELNQNGINIYDCPACSIPVRSGELHP